MLQLVRSRMLWATFARKAEAVPENPLPKFDEALCLGTYFGIRQMSKISHAAKYRFWPIRFRTIRRPALVFSAVDWALQLIPSTLKIKLWYKKLRSSYYTRKSTKDARSEDQSPYGKGMAYSEAKAKKALARRR